MPANIFPGQKKKTRQINIQQPNINPDNLFGINLSLLNSQVLLVKRETNFNGKITGKHMHLTKANLSSYCPEKHK